MRTVFYLILCAFVGCTFPRTQTIIEIRADERVASEANNLRVEVFSASGASLLVRDLNPQGNDFPGFPLSIPVSSRGDETSFELRAVATSQRRSLDGTVTTMPIAQNRVRTPFRRGQVLRYPLWLLSGCNCDVETERCEPDANGDAVPECVPITINVDPIDAGHDAAPADSRFDAAASDSASTDASIVDTSPMDAGAIDASATDTGATDTGAIDARGDAGPPVSWVGVDALDMLFLIDNSGSMQAEQLRFTEQIPRMINVLSTGDLSGAGTLDRDFPHLTSLHVGIVVSDMGAGGAVIGSAAACVTASGMSASVGRFGRLVQRVFNFPGDVAADVGTQVNSVGTGGCGIERQIDALTRAISPASATPWTRVGWIAPEFAGTNGAIEQGHAGPGGLNDGFVRAASALVVIVLSDEDDSSLQANTNATEYFAFPTGASGLHPSVKASIEWYNASVTGQSSAVRSLRSTADSLVGLRAVSGLLFYSAIVGIPADMNGATPAQILRDPRMRPRVFTRGGMCPVASENCGECDPAFETACAGRAAYQELVPVCLMPNVTVNNVALATPAYREVELGQELASLGARVSIQSICQSDYTGAVDNILQTIATARR